MNANHSPLAYACLLAVNPDDGSRLRFDDYPYIRQPLDDLAPRIVIQKGAQVGATVMAVLRALWFVDVRQAHTMYLFPTHRSAQRFSQGRFRTLLEQSGYFRGLFRTVKSMTHYRTGVANFYCHGARSRTELLSTPVQYLTLDERDELYLGRCTGPQPWSAAELARQRLSGQHASWELNLSTPTIPGHGIAAEFAQSDQQYYHPRCPHCHVHVNLTWPEAVDASASVPAFRCPHCRRPWTEGERREALRAGRWLARHPERELRGYHLSQLLSPAASAPRLVRQWLAAQDRPAALQVFYNSVLGLPYVAEGARLEARYLEAARAGGGYPLRHSSQASVMGVDVGPTWHHVVVAEVADAVLRVIWVGQVAQWRDLADLIARYSVQAYVIDAMPETHQVRELLRAFPQGMMCYYRGPLQSRAVDPPSRILRVPRTEALDAMYLRWRLGRVTLPRGTPAEFDEHLAALVRVVRVDRDGQAVAMYLDAGGADHYAHAMTYCELAVGLRGAPLRFEITPPAGPWSEE